MWRPRRSRRAFGAGEEMPKTALFLCFVASFSLLAAMAVLLSRATGPGGWLYAEMTPPLLGSVVLGGLVVAACWQTLAVRAAAVPGTALITFSVLWPALAVSSQLPASARSTLVATVGLAIPGIALLVRGWPAEPPRGPWIPVALVASGLSVVLRAIGYDPFLDPGCSWTCVTVTTGATWQDQRTLFTLTASMSLLAAFSVIVSIRRTPLPPWLHWSCLIAALCAGIAAVAPTLSWDSDDRMVEWLAYVVAVLLVTTGLTAVCRRVRLLRAAVRSVVDDLGDATTFTHPLVHALQFAIPGGTWVETTGQPATEPTAGTAIVLADNATPVARVLLEDDLSEASLDDVFTPARRLAVENARLETLNRRQLGELRRSYERIASAAADERHRIERDLHDGAQQHLVAAAIHLASLSMLDTDRSSEWEASVADVRLALASLRDLTHGDHGEGPT